MMSWDIDLDVELLGYLADDHKNETLKDALVGAADRGAKINAQFWVSRGTTEYMPSHSQETEALLLRKLGHKNIKVFVDYGRGGVRAPDTWVNAMRAIVFDRILMVVSTFNLNPEAFGSDLFAPSDFYHVRVGTEIKMDGWEYDLTVRQRSERTFGLKIKGPVANGVAQLAFHRQESFCANLWRPSKYPGCNESEKLAPILAVPHYRSPYEIEDEMFLEKDYCHASINGQFKLLGVSQRATQITEDYEHIIETAENYLYIENGYFIGKRFNDRSIFRRLPKNTLVEKVAKRIERAINECSHFSVVIVLPMVNRGESALLESWKTLFQPTVGLIPHLEAVMRQSKTNCSKELDDFISVNWLGAEHRLTNGDSVFFTVYTHASLLIADDSKMSIGSVNWNDRSLLGSDADLNIYVDQSLHHIRRAALNGLFLDDKALAVDVEAACTDRQGKTSTGFKSLARIFHDEGKRNNELIRGYMGLDLEHAEDTLTHSNFLDAMTKWVLSLFVRGKQWKQRRERRSRRKAFVGHLFNYASDAFENMPTVEMEEEEAAGLHKMNLMGVQKPTDVAEEVDAGAPSDSRGNTMGAQKPTDVVEEVEEGTHSDSRGNVMSAQKLTDVVEEVEN
eukprot:GEMP01012643.1.p1 GENE.GEMP01012643.1~~GEMP01012643.1.p1  ORF type:complete len:621 (+),score=146.59 GEMP01012643.1:286-2148(+)